MMVLNVKLQAKPAAAVHFPVTHLRLVRRQHHDMQHSVRHLTLPLASRNFGVR